MIEIGPHLTQILYAFLVIIFIFGILHFASKGGG